jgi:hypothetical protein
MGAATMRARLLSPFLFACTLTLACGARTPIATGSLDDASVTPDAAADAPPDVRPDMGVVCKNQRRACFTTAELIELWNAPPEGGRRDGGPPPLDPNGCLPANAVQDDCCQPAVAGPELESGTCCYQICAGACCDGTR